MTWESRKGRGAYYTRSRREGGRVVREYVGTGETARLIAEFDRMERDEREAEAAIQREQRKQDAELDGLVSDFCGLVDGLARGLLLTEGYHQHHYGEWRRRRGKAGES